MDSVASLVIFVFIAKASFDIFKDAMNKMIDHSCDEETEQQIYDCIIESENVLGIDVDNFPRIKHVMMHVNPKE